MGETHKVKEEILKNKKKIMTQKEFKFEMKPFSWKAYQKVVKNPTPENKVQSDLLKKILGDPKKFNK